MDYGSDLLLARGYREGGPETCRSHRRVARVGWLQLEDHRPRVSGGAPARGSVLRRA